MESNCTKEIYIHRIDKNEVIVSLSDNWVSFAEENFGTEIRNPANVIGFSLWDFIHDQETKHLYKIILQEVKKHQRPATVPFRCDSPEKRRFLELSVFPMKDDAIEFESRLTRTESREPVHLLKFDIDRSVEFVRICSICKKIAVSDTEWEEVEVAMKTMKLFEKEQLPQLTHGVCPSCYNKVTAELYRTN